MSNVISLLNIKTNKKKSTPVSSFGTQPTAKIHPSATVTGNVYLGKRVFLAASASVCADMKRPIWIGDDVTIDNSAVVLALEVDLRELVPTGTVEVEGQSYGVYIDDRAIITPQSQIHSPVSIGSDTYVGMQSLIFRAIIGSNCIIEPKALVMGVEIDNGRYVPPGAVITTQAAADALPLVPRHHLLRDLEGVAARVEPLPSTSDRQKIEPESKIA